MSQPLQFYISEKSFFEEELSIVTRKLLRSSVLRLIVFCSTISVFYFFYSNAGILVPLLLAGIALFVYLVSRHTDLNIEKRKLETLVTINQTEIDVLNGDVSKLDPGKEFENQLHEFSYDIDLFGKGSFFQYLNRTVIPSGRELLAKLLTANEIGSIEQKQDAILDLSEKPEWRQNFAATGSLVAVEIDSKQILGWLKNHERFVPKSMRYLPPVFSIVSLAIFILNYLAILPLSVTIIWMLIGLGVTGAYLKKINRFYHNANKAQDTFRQYHQLLYLIETESFSSKILSQKQAEIKSETTKASQIFLEFSKMLDAFDQRNNMLIGVVANAFALRDLQICFKIEKWILMYEAQVANWFDVIAFYDTYNSLANFSFNHPDYTFPKIVSEEFIIEATRLGHPLISEGKRINNDFAINREEFFIITGANMAGKSTFLRTVSLSIIMANIGLPVCATEYSYRPIKLITSMRTSDSLTDDESYFFSELKRLKFIIDEINPKGKAGQYFIILDEILKGTNSTDKAIGSRKFVKRLVSSNSTGIIATHDLSLCEISKELSEVKNYYFDAEIIDDELHFDYRFKEGICKNMNASFLLKKMDII